MKTIDHSKRNDNFRTAALFIAAFFLSLISSCCKENCNCDKSEIDYTRFFIAHASGSIDGIMYTNSLEALDLSYNKGCRLFELDLLRTTDGKYVATHGWEHYKTITNYQGIIEETPMSEEEFLSLKIYGKYTPLNMDAINLWFQNHPDAILVTDKTNVPENIFNEFLFPDRVIMELFSWKAVDKALELGIKPMPSESLIFGSSEKAIGMGIPPQPRLRNSDIEQILEDKKIEYIGTGLFLLQENKNLFRRLKEKGIKCYVWIPMNTERYVWNNEMSFCYGMYADNLDLLASLINRKKCH